MATAEQPPAATFLPAQGPSVPDVARDSDLPCLQRIHFEAEKHHRILSFSNSTKALELWFWPVLESGERVAPDALISHRQTHCFTGPGCLCSKQSIDGIFTEVLIFMVATGCYAGQWVAACAAGRCKYWVFLEKLYSKPGLPIRLYPRRETGEPIPDPVCFGGEAADYPPTQPNSPASNLITPEPNNLPVAGPSVLYPMTTRLGKRRNAEVDFNPFMVPSTPKRQKPAPGTVQSVFAMLMKLDDISQPGLTTRQLKALFTKCAECGLIMTRRTYEHHECNLDSERVEVIDLTGSDSDSDIEV
ncbi:hypothetical protein PAXRUDRAFT_174432 [Paxillus rubicundulus Ve08.2h10]|uniref:Uncharacterized protein n=1 Tax=Paxillus rubicundulus Ve08.2h10 TaxID=930991 RepID=A0A0D0CI74_9AGAM|nr:hypothetical protein PAXRUDRAFT_174432 [Paxillus rubicundulus Ve08.2h10]